MSRPSRIEQRRLERLEGISGLLVSAMQSASILSLRLRQIGRRAPELASWLELANRELAELVDRCDDAHELVKAQLQAEQRLRTATNGGQR